jgi:hypothetical protein
MVSTVETPFKVELHFTVIAEGEMFTAICEEIPGLVTCAPTMDRLLAPMLPDAIVSWFDAAKTLGQLDSVLGKLGVNPSSAGVTFQPILTGEPQQVRYALRAS